MLDELCIVWYGCGPGTIRTQHCSNSLSISTSFGSWVGIDRKNAANEAHTTTLCQVCSCFSIVNFDIVLSDRALRIVAEPFYMTLSVMAIA